MTIPLSDTRTALLSPGKSLCFWIWQQTISLGLAYSLRNVILRVVDDSRSGLGNEEIAIVA
jgi:hypothetical protein